MKKAKYSVGLMKLIAVFALLAGLATARAQGHYAPVTAQDLDGAKFNHYYDANMKAVNPPDFTWQFTATNFTIRAATGPLPPDVMHLFADGMKDVKTIESRYQIKSGEMMIMGIFVDGRPTRTMVKLPVHRTAPTVIRIGKQQYVFTPKT